MAKTDNFFNLQGKIGDLIFCNRNGKTYVKIYSGGFTNGKSHQHPNTQRAQQEFKEVSTFVKNLKTTLMPVLWKQKDGTFYNQLVSLFSSIKKKTRQKELYQALIDEKQLQLLRNKPLNKNCKLRVHNCYYDSNMQQLTIDKMLLHNCYTIAPKEYVEISISWLAISKELDITLNNTDQYYIHLNEYKTPLEDIIIPYTNSQESNNELIYPLLVLSIVNTPNENSYLFHNNHYTLATFL